MTPMIGKTVADASRGGVVEGGGGFGIVGRTPPTGGSYGSFATSIPTPQQHGVGVGGFDSYGTYAPPAPGTVIHRPNVEGVGMRVGGLHGNTRFQPTPVVPRGGGIGGEVPPYNPPILSQQMRMQSPGMQYYLQSGVKDVNVPPPQQQQEQLSSQRKQHPQSKQQMQRKKLDPVMEGNEDEDPSMLRYESRPGMDASPMVEASKDPNRVVGDEAGGQGLAEAAGATHGMTPSRSGAGKVRHGGIGKCCRERSFQTKCYNLHRI